ALIFRALSSGRYATIPLPSAPPRWPTPLVLPWLESPQAQSEPRLRPGLSLSGGRNLPGPPPSSAGGVAARPGGRQGTAVPPGLPQGLAKLPDPAFQPELAAAEEGQEDVEGGVGQDVDHQGVDHGRGEAGLRRRGVDGPPPDSRQVDDGHIDEADDPKDGRVPGLPLGALGEGAEIGRAHV